MAEKRCSKCGLTKSVSEFYKDRRSKTGLRSKCKDCEGVYAQSDAARATRARYKAKFRKPKEVLEPGQKRCSKCKTIKSDDAFYRSENGKLSSWCIACNAEHRKSKARKKALDKYNRSEKGHFAGWRYRNTEKGKKNKKAYTRQYNQQEAVKQANRIKSAKHKRRYPNRNKARLAVGHAVERGDMPPARHLLCAHCGEPALEYHHHKGYARKHWLDVIPLCHPCHTEADLKA